VGKPLKRFALGLLLLFPLLRAVRGMAFGYSFAGVGDDLVRRMVAQNIGSGLVYGAVAGMVAAVALAVLVGRVSGEMPARPFMGRVAVAGLTAGGAVWLLGDGTFTGIPAGILADVMGAFLLVLLPRTFRSLVAVVVGCIVVEVASWTVPWLFEHHDVGFAAALPRFAVGGALVGANGVWGLAIAHVGFLAFARCCLIGALAPVVPPANIAGALRGLAYGTTRLTVTAAQAASS